MKRLLLSVLLCTFLITPNSLSAATSSSQQRTVSIDDLVLLVHSGISDQTILLFLENFELGFVLTTEIVQRLSQAGITNTVMQYLKDKEAALTSPPLPAGTTLTGYNRVSYPSYYRSGRISGTGFPFFWYSHHYFRLHHAARHPYTPIHIGYPGMHHEVGITHNLHNNLTHSRSLGDHQNSLTHSIYHKNSGLDHTLKHPVGHSYGHVSSRIGGHNIGHAIGHSLGHTGRRHTGGHSYGHSRKH